ncbi:DUF5131 family protein [Nocardia amamiensis]|uniref:DUF5131 family protein n=1 Tax=Nocardia amamiensis TaxID=404578 RepID=A0ABS0CQU1_9NOCA|nr:DUF5131 family protein [Nocardia amamiensis]
MPTRPTDAARRVDSVDSGVASRSTRLLRTGDGQATENDGRRQVPSRRRPQDLRARVRRDHSPCSAGHSNPMAETRLVFVNSMSDLFHARVPESFIRDVFDVIRQTPQHTYQVLTKRSLRARRLADRLNWPANLWMGVSVENQEAVVRAEHLRQIPAAVRFVSCEPLLGPVNLWPSLFPNPCPARCGCRGGIDRSWNNCESPGDCCDWEPEPQLHWVMAGGESGPAARPMRPDWARQLNYQCRHAGVPFFFKLLCTMTGASHDEVLSLSGAAQPNSSGRVEMSVDGELCGGADDGGRAGPGQDGPEAIEYDDVFAVAGEDVGDLGGDCGADGVAVLGGAPFGLAHDGKPCCARSEGGIERPEANLAACVLEDLELGYCADSRPLVGGKRQIQDVDESGGWMAQVGEQSDDAGSRNQRDHSGHMVADRVKAVSGVEFLFELGVRFDHRWTISTITSAGCQWSGHGGRSVPTVAHGAFVVQSTGQWGGRTPKQHGRILDGQTWNQMPKPNHAQESQITKRHFDRKGAVHER